MVTRISRHQQKVLIKFVYQSVLDLGYPFSWAEAEAEAGPEAVRVACVGATAYGTLVLLTWLLL